MTGQTGRCRVVEDDRGGEPYACRRVDPVAQFHRGQRVEPERLEVLVGVDLDGAVMAEDKRGLGAYESEEFGVPGRLVEAGQSCYQGGRRAGRRS